MDPEQIKKNIVPAPRVGPTTPDVAALVAIIRRLSIAQSLPEIMEVVTHAARTLIGADGITFVLRDRDLCYYAEEDAIAPLWKGRRFPMNICISGWCMIARMAAVVPDIYKDSRIPHDAYRPTFVKSLAMVPVRQDDPMGAIGAYWATVRGISAEEVELLQTIANSAALALARVELERAHDKSEKALAGLSHRLVNMLSVVDAMSRQTMRSSNSPDGFSHAFSSRIGALGRAQTLLNQEGKSCIDLRALIADQLFTGARDTRILYDGPEISLAAHEAFDLGLVLHELATNARRHGALSAAEGRVKITWNLLPPDDARILDFSWVEENGPRVVPPVVGGFGTALFRFAFKKDGGDMQVRYEPSGVVCTVRIPLASLSGR